jgi:predicted DNA-binding transcriptional regulator YafY
MNRVDRLHAILIHLQSKKVVTARELSERFKISVRTVYRDLRALEEGGVPIGAEAGTGYFLSEGYHIPPVMFTRNEANALILGEKLIRKHGDKPLQHEYENALIKIKAVLDKDKKADMEILEKRVVLDPFGLDLVDQSDTPFLHEIHSALPAHNLLKFHYISAYKGVETERTIEPIGLLYYAQRWHLIGYCRLRNDFRDFRLDRISRLEVLREKFESSKHHDIDRYIDKIRSDTELTLVEVRIKKETVRFIDTVKYQFGWVSETEETQFVKMHFAVFSLDLFARWMLMFGRDVTILAPTELKHRVIELVSDLENYYEA